MKDKEQLRKYFENDRYIIKNNIEIVDFNEEWAVCKVNITNEHLNSENVVQGGMIYTLADFTFAVLSNYLHNKAVSQTATITYLRPAINCTTLYAKAREVDCSRRNCIQQVIVYDQLDNTIAIMQMNGFFIDKS